MYTQTYGALVLLIHETAFGLEEWNGKINILHQLLIK